MRVAELVNFIYFSLLTILAVMWPLPRSSKTKAILIGAAGMAVAAALSTASRWLPADAASILRDWLPAPLMAAAYWQSGCFFQKPNAALQRIFEASDNAILKLLHIDLSSLARTWLGTILELAYVLCYPVVPLGVAALYFTGFRDRADHYWMVVLLSAYPSYALLPFIQLLPPRLVKRPAGTTQVSASLRRFNLWLVRRVTHEANTFPSGHVAASTAIALVLVRFDPLWGVVFAVIALGIAAGCIVGRYHYIVDVGAALLVSVVVFAITFT